MCVMQGAELFTYVDRMELICISVGLNSTALGIKNGWTDIWLEEHNVTLP